MVPRQPVRVWSTIGRPVEPRYPTNRAILMVAAALFVLGVSLRMAQGGALGAAVAFAGTLGVGAFLCWALARELDPDRPLGAFAAVGAFVVLLFVVGVPSLLLAFSALLSLRVMNRTTGLPLTWLDAVIVTGLALWLVWQGSWLAGWLLGIAYLLDATLPSPHRPSLGYAAVTFLGTFLWLGLSRELVLVGVGVTAYIASALAVLAGLVLLRGARRVVSTGDRTAEVLVARRVQAAQVVACIGFVGIAFVHGLAAGIPLLAALAGAAAYRLVRASPSAPRPSS